MELFGLLLIVLIQTIVEQIDTWAERRRKKRAAGEKSKPFGKAPVAAKSQNPLFMAGRLAGICVAKIFHLGTRLLVLTFKAVYLIGWLLVVLSWVLLKRGWQTFDKLTYPDREIDREREKLQEFEKRFETYGMEMVQEVEEYYNAKRSELHERCLEAGEQRDLVKNS